MPLLLFENQTACDSGDLPKSMKLVQLCIWGFV
jgi:hypothetical protein